MFNNGHLGTSLAVQWLRLLAPNAGDMGSIPGQETKIPHATQHGQKQKQKQNNGHLKEMERFSHSVFFVMFLVFFL